jgi:hypothetical protein
VITLLQIISGKFFTENGVINEHSAKGILYSNYSWYDLIETVIASLEPADIHGNAKGFVVNYVNKLERDEQSGGFSLVRTGDPEIVRQFQLLCTFGLNAYFHFDKQNVEINCRERSRGMGDEHIPAQLVPRIFNKEINGTAAEIESFSKFVQKVISLRRQDYKNIMACLTNYSDSLEIMNQNLDLAYTMLIYSMEALSKQYNNYTPIWDDYDPLLRKELEEYFALISSEISESIKSTLIKASHLKLQQNFIDFICNHMSDSFFEDEAAEVEAPLRASDLRRALRNAYILRSGYVHELKTLLKQLKIPSIAKGDVFRWENEPYLTYSGLIRVVRHVINNFIWKLDSVEKEDYNWRADLPGIVNLELAPQYWIWRYEGFETNQATKRLSGFLSELDTANLTQGSVTDISLLLEKMQELFPQARKQEKITMLCLYALYCLLVEGNKPVNYENFLQKNDELLSVCCIETLITFLLLGQEWQWNTEACITAYNNYNEMRFSKKSIKLPNTHEIAILCRLGNLVGNEDKEYWYKKAIHESAGRVEIQKYIKQCMENRTAVDIKFVLSGCKELK